MSDTPDIPGDESPLDPTDPAESADTTPAAADGNGHKNGKNGAHALDKPKNGNGNGNGKHAVDPPKENGTDNVKEKNGKNGNGKNGNGKNGSFFSDKRFQIGILATLVIASLGVWLVIFQEVSGDNARDLPAPAGEFDPNLVTESTGEPATDPPAEISDQGSEPSVESETSIPNEATSDAQVVADAGTIDDVSSVTGDVELRERGFFDAIYKFRDPFQTPNPVTEPGSGSVE